MASMTRHESTSPLAELLDWFESGVPGTLRAMVHPVRVEDYREGDRYVVRAELPGIDPEKDVEITVAGGMLTIRGQRREEQRDKHRSEFRYGSFERRITLPPGIREEDVQAQYKDGILEVSFPIGQPQDKPRRIEVQRTTSQ